MQKKHSQLHQSCFYNAEVKMQVNVLCSMMVFQQQLAGQSCRLALLSPLFKLNNVCKENRNDRNCCTKISIMWKKRDFSWKYLCYMYVLCWAGFWVSVYKIYPVDNGNKRKILIVCLRASTYMYIIMAITNSLTEQFICSNYFSFIAFDL